MRLLNALSAPRPVPVQVRWSRPARDVLATLAELFAQQPITVPSRYGPGHLRLDGSVTGTTVTIAATTMVIGRLAGLSPPSLWLAGEVRDVDGGSEMAGSLSPTFPLGLAIVCALVAVPLLLWDRVPASVLLVAVTLVVGVVALLHRRQQRRLLREADSIEGYLVNAVDGPDAWRSWRDARAAAQPENA